MKKAVFLVMGIVSTLIMRGQTQQLELTLNQAIDMALKNNRNLQLAKYDQQIAKKSRWEAISNFLPKANFESTWMDNLKLNTVLLPGIMFGYPPDQYIPVQFGQEFQWSWAVKIQQVIFSAPLLIANNLAIESQKMNDLNYEKTENEIVATIKNIFVAATAITHSLNILDSNISNLEYVRERTKAMYSLGMVQSTDVDQIDITITNLKNTRHALQRNYELMLNMIRFNLGLDTTQQLVIKEKIDDFIKEEYVKKLLMMTFQLENTPDFQLLKTQENMMKISLNKEKMDVLPTLAAFYNYTKTGQGNEMRDLKWFPSSVVGVTVSIPIFAGTQNYVQIQKARIQYEKAIYQTQTVEEQLLIQERQLKYNVKNAYDNYLLQKKNIDLAYQVYKNVEDKYLQGMASSLDLTQANTNYLSAQNNYISACNELINAMTNLEKLYNIKIERQ